MITGDMTQMTGPTGLGCRAMGPPPWTLLSLLWTKMSTQPWSPADGTQLSPGCTQISPQVGTQMSPRLGTQFSPQWTHWTTGWTVLSPP